MFNMRTLAINVSLMDVPYLLLIPLFILSTHTLIEFGMFVYNFIKERRVRRREVEEMKKEQPQQQQQQAPDPLRRVVNQNN